MCGTCMRVEQRLMLAGMLVLPGVQVVPKRLSTQSRLEIVLSHIMYSRPEYVGAGGGGSIASSRTVPPVPVPAGRRSLGSEVQ